MEQWLLGYYSLQNDSVCCPFLSAAVCHACVAASTHVSPHLFSFIHSFSHIFDPILSTYYVLSTGDSVVDNPAMTHDLHLSGGQE